MQNELNKYYGSIRSYTGEQISIVNPEKNKYRIIDIAKGLSYKGLFAGQTPFYFSIAEHTALVIDLYIAHKNDRGEKPDPKMKMAMLLHDASEAFLPDMPKPYKNLMPIFEQFENAMQGSIFTYYDLPFLMLAHIKPFDTKAQDTEFAIFQQAAFEQKLDKGIKYKSLDPEKIVGEFLNLYWDIVNEIILEKNGTK